MSRQKILKFCDDNIVAIVGIGVIVGVHWGWSRLQQTSLVPEEKRKELPIIIAYNHFRDIMAKKISNLRGAGTEG